MAAIAESITLDARLVQVPPWWTAAGAVPGVVVGLAAGSASTGLLGVVIGVSAAWSGWWDVRCRRIPNAVVLATLGGALSVAVLAAVSDGTAAALWGFVLGAIVASTPLFVVHLVDPRSVGFGDVKYSLVLGGSLGVVDWRLAAGVVAAASIVGPMLALVVRSWRSSMPFGLLLGATALTVFVLQAGLIP